VVFVLPAAGQDPATITQVASPDAAVRFFEVDGGQFLPALRCPPPARPKPRPGAGKTPSTPPGAPAPAGSTEEIVPLSAAEEKDMVAQAFAPPDARELAGLKPSGDRLDSLQARLNEAAIQGGPRVGIWGGSHMAAEYFTTEVRRALQTQWGPGGIGHTHLLRGRAGVRLPMEAVLCRQGWKEEVAPRAPGSPDLEAGAGLYALVSQAGAQLEADWQSLPAEQQPTELTLQVLQHDSGGSFDLWVDNVLLGRIETSGPRKLAAVKVVARAPIARLMVQATGDSPVKLVGLYADTAQGAVLDNFGIAGASGAFWLHVPTELLQQAQALRPYDLIMLAYGTNDVTGPQWDPAAYRARFEQTLQMVRQAHPQAACILITPGDRATSRVVRKTIRKGNRNQVVRQVVYDLRTFPERHAQAARIQAELGATQGCLTWDMSLAMRRRGGAWAMMKASPPLMASDLIHLTPAGYREMAREFVEWLRLPVPR
jgi:lysophospholipase L1-like esterase